MSHLAFAGIASFALNTAFIFFRQLVIVINICPERRIKTDRGVHADKPSNLKSLASIFLLLTSLLIVVGLAEALNPAIESAVNTAGAPKTVVGIAIGMLVLMPEGYAAVPVAKANRLQSSLNLALGSALDELS
jgi:Ca2+:H+ antiporter